MSRRRFRPVVGRRRGAATALGAVSLLGLVGVAPQPASAAGAGAGVIDVTVTSATGIAPSPPAVSAAATLAPENQDVHQQLTTFRTNLGPQPPYPFRTGFAVIQKLVPSGMSFAQLARLSGIAPQTLIAGPNAVTVTADGGGSLIHEMSLSEAEVVDGFSDPCGALSVCPDNMQPDSAPNYAWIGADDPANSFVVSRPLRLPLDENGNNQVQTAVGGDLDVTFHVLGNVLQVGAPSESATTVPVGGSVRFGPPTIVTFNGTPDTSPSFSYAWNFGDGHTGTGPSPSNVYTALGTYPVFVTVTDSQQRVGVSSEITVQATGPPPPPPFKPFPPTPAPKPTPHPSVAASPPAPQATIPAPVSHAVVTAAPHRPASSSPAVPSVPRPKPKPKPSLSTDGAGSGSGTGSGNGQGAGSGAGSGSGVAGAGGHSALGVAVGGSPSGESPTLQEGQLSAEPPAVKVNGLVGVLIDPSGGAVALSPAASSATSDAAAAARALAGGARSDGVSWLGWLLGVGLVGLVTGGRALAEFEPRAAYRSLRTR
jgi:hypothetical protein